MQDPSSPWPESSIPTEAEMFASLMRSGYLLESEVAKLFVSRGYFVETNQVLKDPITGKSRELDLLAEYREIDPICGEVDAYSKIYLICEVKNNLYPIVLLTPYSFSPNGDERGDLKQGQTGEGLLQGFDLDYFISQWTYSLSQQPQFTQYCSFERKKNNNKNELMAVHPEELYIGLSKITQACEEAVDRWQSTEMTNHLKANRAHRNHLYLPVLIVKDHLYELSSGADGRHAFQQVQSSRLHFAYYYNDEPRTAMVYVVTQSGLNPFIDDMLELERKAIDHLVNGLRKGLE